MKIRELLQIVESEDKCINGLKGYRYDHIPEFYDFDAIGWDIREDNERIVHKTHKYVDFDGRRYWEISSYWMDDKPIMITQNAGREGDDYSRRFIVDKYLYREMMEYLLTLIDIEEVPKVYDLDYDGEDLTNFYNKSFETVHIIEGGK